MILGPCLHAFPNNPMRPDQSQAQPKEARAGSVRNTGTSPCYGDKIKRRGAEAYAAARLRDGGGGGEGAPAAVSGAPGCGGAVPGCERRRRRARLLRGARRRGSRLRLLDVCQRQSKKVPLQTPTTLFSTARAVSLLVSLRVLTLDTQHKASSSSCPICSTVPLVVE